MDSDSDEPDYETNRKRRKLDIDSSILVKVGADETTTKSFNVPPYFLRSSEFFTACLNPRSEWAERESTSIRLEETDPEIFEHYLEFLYTKALPLDKFYDPGTLEIFLVLAKLYILADKLCDESFRNEVMDRFSGYSGSLLKHERIHHEPELLTLVFNSTPTECALQRFLVDLEVHHPSLRDREALAEELDSLPSEYLAQLLRATLPLKAEKLEGPYWRDKCHYHEHKTTRMVESCESMPA